MPTNTVSRKSKSGPKTKSSTRARKSSRKGTRKTTAPSVDARTLQRPLWIAVGAIALATEAVQDFVEESLKRGEKLETRARKEISKRRNGNAKPVRRQTAKAKKAPQKKNGGFADRFLNALEIPSHTDIVSLEKKVDAIARKVA